MTTDYEIRSGKRPVSIRSGPSAQQALLDYVRSLGCSDAEIIRLGADSVSWRARFGPAERAVSIKSARARSRLFSTTFARSDASDAEIVRLGAAAVSWRGARYTAVAVPSGAAD